MIRLKRMRNKRLNEGYRQGLKAAQRIIKRMIKESAGDDPWEIDMTPENNGLVLLPFPDFYVQYFEYGDSDGMDEEDVLEADNILQDYSYVAPAQYNNGEWQEPYYSGGYNKLDFWFKPRN